MTRTRTRTVSAVFVSGVVGALLTVPGTASAMTIGGPSAECVDGVSASARGGFGVQDTREITPAEQKRIEARTQRILARQRADAAKGKPTNPGGGGGHGGGGGGNDPGGSITKIPVYVHEMLGSHREGDVTDAQVAAQIDVLNQTYSGHDTDGTSPVDTGARFVLAGHDEYLNDNWHVDRQSSRYRSKTREGGRNALNIWLVDFGYLGIATFPWDYDSNPGIDGIRVHWDSLPGGSITHYNQGETATHEAGHWLGLYHTFQGGCNPPGDEVDDTPYQASPSSGCPEGNDTCPAPGSDPVHNYMDYSYDNCYTEFSNGQVSRIDTNWVAYRGTLN